MQEHELDLLEEAYHNIENVLLNYREGPPLKYVQQRTIKLASEIVALYADDRKACRSKLTSLDEDQIYLIAEWLDHIRYWVMSDNNKEFYKLVEEK